MKILQHSLELIYGNLDGNYSEETMDTFDEMLNKLEEDELGYIHYEKISVLYFKGITKADKKKLAKEVKAESTK